MIEDLPHFGIKEDEWLGNLAWKVVLPMYMDLQVPPKTEMILELTEGALDDAETLADQWVGAWERMVFNPEEKVRFPAGILGVREREVKSEGEQSPCEKGK